MTPCACVTFFFFVYVWLRQGPITQWLSITTSCISMGEKEVSLQEILSGFVFIPGFFGIVLRGGYLYGAWPRTVLILIEFKFIVPELWQLVVFCTCRILPEGLKFVENDPQRVYVWHFFFVYVWLRQDPITPLLPLTTLCVCGCHFLWQTCMNAITQYLAHTANAA